MVWFVDSLVVGANKLSLTETDSSTSAVLDNQFACRVDNPVRVLCVKHALD